MTSARKQYTCISLVVKNERSQIVKMHIFSNSVQRFTVFNRSSYFQTNSALQ